MTLSVSQIAWTPDKDAEAHSLLKRCGVAALELAPTRSFPRLDEVTKEQATALRSDLTTAGLPPGAMQALLFGRPELLLFSDEAARAALMKYLKAVVTMASQLGVGPMVFGSPKNRARGAMGLDEAHAIAVPFFRELGDFAAPLGCIIGMEPNPPQYACDYLTNTSDTADFVAAVNSPGCRLHFDTGATVLNGEDPLALLEKFAPQLCHYHVSQPFLEDFSSCAFPHAECGKRLRAAGYTGLVSIEMKQSPRGLEALEEALRLTTECYG